MSQAVWSDFYDYVLPHLAGGTPAPAMVANAVRNAAIEFLDGSNVYVVDHPTIDIVALQTAYVMQPPAGYDTAGIQVLWYRDDELLPTAVDELRRLPHWASQGAIPVTYICETEDSFRLVPCPTANESQAINLRVSLKPTRTSSGLESWIFAKYATAIADGALAALMEMRGKPWTDDAEALRRKAAFTSATRAAKASANKGNARAQVRVRLRRVW